jgi:ABC-type phosphate transport system substrate-binding protein
MRILFCLLVFFGAFTGLCNHASATTLINGAGSTFAEPIYVRWFAEFQKKEKDVQFNYQGVGSGAGMKQMLEGTVDFAGTDSRAPWSRKYSMAESRLGTILKSPSKTLASSSPAPQLS